MNNVGECQKGLICRKDPHPKTPATPGVCRKLRKGRQEEKNKKGKFKSKSFEIFFLLCLILFEWFGSV